MSYLTSLFLWLQALWSPHTVCDAPRMEAVRPTTCLPAPKPTPPSADPADKPQNGPLNISNGL